MEASKKKNEELHTEITRHKDEVNNIKYRLGNIEKSQKEFSEGQKTLMEKIDKLLQKENKIDTLINTSEEGWKSLLRMSKDKTIRMLDEQIERIDQLTEGVDALCVEPLAFRKPPQSPESENASDQRNQEEPKNKFLRKYI